MKCQSEIRNQMESRITYHALSSHEDIVNALYAHNS